MLTVGNLYERERVFFIVDLLVQVENFIQIYHEEMSKEEFEAFKRVTEYLSDIEVEELLLSSMENSINKKKGINYGK